MREKSEMKFTNSGLDSTTSRRRDGGTMIKYMDEGLSAFLVDSFNQDRERARTRRIIRTRIIRRRRIIRRIRTHWSGSERRRRRHIVGRSLEGAGHHTQPRVARDAYGHSARHRKVDDGPDRCLKWWGVAS